MPFSPIIALFATGLALVAGGWPVGGIFLVVGTIMLSLKLGMPVVKHEPPRDGRQGSRRA